MRTTTIAAITTVAAVLVAAVAWSLRDDGPGAIGNPLMPDGTAAATSARAAGTGDDTAAAPLQQTPQARDWRQRQAFEARARDFRERVAGMGAVQRSEEAAAMEHELRQREQAGEVSAGESLLLRLALIDATSANDAERMARGRALAERYREDAVRREARWAAQQARDPRFIDYKAREQAIVAEVTAMAAIPDGLSRDEYLRRRLQRAREDSYAGAAMSR